MPGQSLIFECRYGMYICDMDKYAETADKGAYITTVEDMKRLYTAREVAAAQRAKEKIINMGNPSAKNVVAAIRGGMANISFTVQDVYRAYKIWGPDLGAVRGKTTRTTEDAVIAEETKGLLAPLNLTMHADIMFVEGLPFLTAVLTPLCFTVVELLKGRTAGVVKTAINKMLAMVRRQGYDVSWILSDGEGAIVALKDELNLDVAVKARVNTTGAGDHVPVVENKIRQIKGGVRGIIATLPYLVPLFLIVYLVSHVVFCINMFPSRATSESVPPYESFTGLKPCGKDFPLAFGEYVEVHEKRAITNTMEARTQSGIYLGQSGNIQKSGKFYSLSTGHVVVRSRWTKFPMPSIVISHLNDLAEKKGAARRDPVFQIYEHVIVSDDEPRDGVPSMPTRNVYDDMHAILENLPPEEELPPVLSVPIVDQELNVSASVEEGNPVPVIPGLEEGVVLADTADDMVPTPPNIEDDYIFEDNEIFEDQSDSRSGGEQPAVILESEEVATEPTWGGGRLRGERKYGHKDGGWKERKFNMMGEREFYAYKMSIKEAMTKYPDASAEAITNELSQLHGRGVFLPIRYSDIPATKKVIRSSMFLKEKFDADGKFTLIKARMVAGGHQQDRSLYEEEDITAPTVQLASVYAVASIAASATIDFPGAYLNAELKEEVFMRIERRLVKVLMDLAPEVYKDYISPHGDMIVKLKKALYGLGESAKLWNDLLSKELRQLGFTSNPKDNCVFNKTINGNQMTILVYVDDLFITCKSPVTIEEIFGSLAVRYPGLKMKRGPVVSYLGQTFDFSVVKKCKVTMEGYVNDVLDGYKVEGMASTPAGDNLFIVGGGSKLSQELTEVFHSRVAKLFYLAKRVRPDILTAVAWLATRVREPTSTDLEKLDRVLKYLHATPAMGICLGGGNRAQCIY